MMFERLNREKPKRPYANLLDFASRGLWWDSKRLGHVWPCMTCKGKGWDYDPNDPPCPIEGNKMRDRLRCSTCSGTGVKFHELHFGKVGGGIYVDNNACRVESFRGMKDWVENFWPLVRKLASRAA